MCDKHTPAEQENALVSAQNLGTILLMVAWAVACLLALCTVAIIIAWYRSQRLGRSHSLDNVIVVTASLCALGSTIAISTAVDSGLGKRSCLLSSADVERVQLKLFISTILFVLAISISKCSVLLFLYNLVESTLQRVGVIATGVLVLLWTVAVLVFMVFQCEMQTPWDIWTGKCIPLVPFWLIATFVDIVIDLAIVIFSTYTVLTLRIARRQKTSAMILLSLRLILVAASVVRLFFLEPAFSKSTEPTFASIPYITTSQCQATLAALLACSLTLQSFMNLFQTIQPASPNPRKSRHSKHWSGTTIGGTPYESYASSPIIKEPLPSIQASMSSPSSPSASRNSLGQDILLPDIPLPEIPKKVPRRPPPPSEEQRPDLSMFRRTTEIRRPPVVTRLGSLRRNREDGREMVWGQV